MGDKKKRREAFSSRCRGLLALEHIKAHSSLFHRPVIRKMTLLPLAWTVFSSLPKRSQGPRASFDNMHSRLELGAFYVMYIAIDFLAGFCCALLSLHDGHDLTDGGNEHDAEMMDDSELAGRHRTKMATIIATGNHATWGKIEIVLLALLHTCTLMLQSSSCTLHLVRISAFSIDGKDLQHLLERQSLNLVARLGSWAGCCLY